MTNDLEEKRNQLALAQQTLEDLKVRHSKIAYENALNPTSENQNTLNEIKNSMLETQQSVKQLTMELSYDEEAKNFDFEDIGAVKEIDHLDSIKPNIPPAESGGAGRALGKGKELGRENVTNETNSRNIDYINKNIPPSVENKNPNENEIEKDNSIEPEI